MFTGINKLKVDSINYIAVIPEPNSFEGHGIVHFEGEDEYYVVFESYAQLDDIHTDIESMLDLYESNDRVKVVVYQDINDPLHAGIFAIGTKDYHKDGSKGE